MPEPLTTQPDYINDPIEVICTPLSAKCQPQWVELLIPHQRHAQAVGGAVAWIARQGKKRTYK